MKKKPRTDDKYTAKEQDKDRQCKRIKRTDDQYTEKEQDKDRRHKRIKRADDQYTAKEQDANKRRMKKERTDDEYTARERGINKSRMKTKRTSVEYVAKEKKSTQQRIQHLRSCKTSQPKSVETVIQDYKSAISEGPTYTCASCFRLLCRRSMVQVKLSNYGRCPPNILQKCISTRFVYICKTCHKTLQNGNMPAQCHQNNLLLVDIPNELKELSSLECLLVAKIIPFMHIVSLTKGSQHGLKGHVVLVPADLSKVCTLLPRCTNNDNIISLALKRRLSDKSAVHKQFIRPTYVNAALLKLKKSNPFYKDVTIDTTWENVSQQSDPDLWEFLTQPVDPNSQPSTSTQEKQTSRLSNDVPEHTNDPTTSHQTSIGQQPSQSPTDTLTDSEDEVEKDTPAEVKQQLKNKRSLNTTTCLQPTHGPSVSTEQILDIAPAEGQIPVSATSQPDWEAMAFPKLFAIGKGHFNDTRPVKITPAKYLNARLQNADDRFATSTEYIFQGLHWLESDRLRSTINISKMKRHHQDINAGTLKNPETVHQLISNDEMFTTFKTIRGTPQYWKNMQLDMLAKIKLFGPYTFFITGSAAEFQWTEVIQVVANQYGKNFSADDIKKMDWQTKRKWLQTNPVLAARQIDYIFQQLWDKVLLSGVHPVGQILNYDIRKEMQGRGTQHFHAAIHVKDAPRLDQDSDEEVIEFIEKYVTCVIPAQETDSKLHHLNVHTRQIHHHTKTGKKKIGVTPLQKTMICRPAEKNTDQKRVKKRQMYSRKSSLLLPRWIQVSLQQKVNYSVKQMSLKRTTILQFRLLSNVKQW